MKLLTLLLVFTSTLAVLVPSHSGYNNADNNEFISSAIKNTSSSVCSAATFGATPDLDSRDLLSIGKKKAKFLKKLLKKKQKIADELGIITKSLEKIERLKKEKDEEEKEWDEESGKSDFDEMKDELIEKLLTKVFISLKNSELINPILKFSLTDDKVRGGIIDITIELLKADVIPYYEIFVALRDSGLALQVIQFLLIDPETRQGQIDLIIELIPRLLEDGVINFDDILKNLPSSIPLPTFASPSQPAITTSVTNANITSVTKL